MIECQQSSGDKCSAGTETDIAIVLGNDLFGIFDACHLDKPEPSGLVALRTSGLGS